MPDVRQKAPSYKEKHVPVFMSHKREDKERALQIAEYFRRHSIVCYVDVLDPTLKTTDDITSTIRERVKQCTHLMALVSTFTERSWWVPFEIGVATETERRISSFQTAASRLPEFLTKWPILKTQSDLDTFIRFYKRDAIVPISEGKVAHPQIRSASQFHRELKASL